MTIQMVETVELSTNEARAFQLVERICNDIARRATNSDLIEAANSITSALVNFTYFWDEVV